MRIRLTRVSCYLSWPPDCIRGMRGVRRVGRWDLTCGALLTYARHPAFFPSLIRTYRISGYKGSLSGYAPPPLSCMVHQSTTGAAAAAAGGGAAGMQLHHGRGSLPAHDLHRIAKELREVGYSVVRRPPWWAEADLAEGAHAMHAALHEFRSAYNVLRTASAVPPAPWEHMSRPDAGTSRWTVPPRERFHFQEGFSYTRGRLSMPLLGTRAPFDRSPFHAIPDLLRLCRATYRQTSGCGSGGQKPCNQTAPPALGRSGGRSVLLDAALRRAGFIPGPPSSVGPERAGGAAHGPGGGRTDEASEACVHTQSGSLWNFPGANSTFWHRDYTPDFKLLTVIIAMHDYPAHAGWLQLQERTQVRRDGEGAASRSVQRAARIDLLPGP